MGRADRMANSAPSFSNPYRRANCGVCSAMLAATELITINRLHPETAIFLASRTFNDASSGIVGAEGVVSPAQWITISKGAASHGPIDRSCINLFAPTCSLPVDPLRTNAVIRCPSRKSWRHRRPPTKPVAPVIRISIVSVVPSLQAGPRSVRPTLLGALSSRTGGSGRC